MAEESPRRPRRRWWRRLALGALLLVGVYLLREPLVHPGLARLISSLATSEGGTTLTIDEIDGDWFRSLGVRGVRVASESGPLREVTVGEAELRFSLWGLLRRRDLSAALSLRVTGVRATVDLTLAAASEGEPPPAATWVSAPTAFPAIETEDVFLDLRASEDLRLVVEDLAITSAGWPTERRIEAHASTARITNADDEWAGPLHLALLASPTEVRIDELKAADLRILEDATLDWSRMAARRLEWSATLADGELQTSGELEGSRLSGTLSTENAQLGTWMRMLPPPLSTLAAELDCTADFALDVADIGSARASLQLDARQVSYLDTQLDNLVGSARFESGTLLVRELRGLQGDANRLEIADLRIPFGAGDARQVVTAMQGGLAFEIHDLSRLPLQTGDGLPEHLFQGAGRIAEGRIELDSGRLDITGGGILVERAALDLREAEMARRSLEVEATVDIADLGQLSRLWGATDYQGSLSGRLSLDGTLGEPSGHIEWTGRGVQLGALPLGDLELFAHTGAGIVRVESLHCVGALGSLDASGSYLIETDSLDGAVLDAEILDLTPLGLLPEQVLALTSPVSLRARLDGPWRAPSGELELHASALEIEGQSIESLSLKAGATEGLVHVDELSFDSPWGHLTGSASGSIPAVGSPTALTLNTLALERGASRLDLSDPVEVEIDGPSFSISPTLLSGSAGTVSFEATGDLEELRIQADAQALDLGEYLAEMPVSMRGINAGFSLEQTPDGSRVATSGRIERVLATESLDDVSVVWDASTSGGRARVEALSVESHGTSLLSLTADLPLDLAAPMPLPEGSLQIDGRLDIQPAWTSQLPLPESLGALQGALAGEFHLNGSWDAVQGDLTCHATDLRLSGPAVVAWFREPAQVDLDLTFGEALAGTLRADLPGLASVDTSGQLQAVVDIPALLEDGTGSLDGWLTAALEATGRFDIESMATLTSQLESIRRLDGRARGDVTLTGSLAEPELVGSMDLDECELKLSSEVPTLKQLSARLRFDHRSLQFEEVRGEMGAAPVNLEGSVDWSETPLAVDVRITGEDVLLVRSASNRLRADAKLHLSGPVDQLHLEGDLGLRASRISQHIDLIPQVSTLSAGGAVQTSSRGFQFFSFREAPLSDMTLDVRIRTVDPLVLSTNVASSSWLIDLHLKGTGNVPLPEGQIFMEETRVKLPAGVLGFEAGRVAFVRANPFVPTIEMRGETRLAGYDVSVVIEGPYDQPEVLLSSSPPLGQSELFLLVLTGELPQTTLSSSSERAAQSITLYLAKDIFARMSSSSLDSSEESLFDRLEVIQGRDVSKTGKQTTEATFRLQEGGVGKRSTLYLVAEQDVYEEYNLGFRILFRFQ